MDDSAWSREELRRVATLYYVQEETMEAIAARAGISRSTVSRQLQAARRLGIVRISVVDEERTGDVAHRFADSFGVRAHVVPVRQSATDSQRLAQVARVAASLLGEWMADDTVLGMAWGTTTSTIAEYLVPKPTRGSSVVQLNGAVHATSAEVLYVSALLGRVCEAFDARPVFFPVPAFFDDPATRAALWRERSVAHVVELQYRCDIALFGVGIWHGGVQSQVYSGGYLEPADIAELESAGAVADICTVFVRADGSYDDIALNARSSGPDPRRLARLPRRVCVASGAARALGVLGALRAGVISDLVLDEDLAAAVLAAAARPVRPGSRSGH